MVLRLFKLPYTTPFFFFFLKKRSFGATSDFNNNGTLQNKGSVEKRMHFTSIRRVNEILYLNLNLV